MDNVLIIDGSNTLFSEAASALEQATLKVTLIPSYPEALRELGSSSFDLIILGDRAADLNIWDACARLRQISGAPIIMVSGEPSKQAWVRALEAGADFYMPNPLSIPELVARAKALLRRYRRPPGKAISLAPRAYD